MIPVTVEAATMEARMSRPDESYKSLRPVLTGVTFEIESLPNDSERAQFGFAKFLRDDGRLVRRVFLHIRDVDAYLDGVYVGDKFDGDLINTDRGLRAVNLSTV